MIKYKQRMTENYTIIVAKLSSKEMFNDKSYNLFAEKYMYGFFTPKKINNKQIEFKAPRAIPLQRKLKTPISKYDLFLIIEQIVDITRRLKEQGISNDKLILDLNQIYLNEITKTVWLIYMPADGLEESMPIARFIESILYQVKLADANDSDIISEFSFFMKNMSTYNPNEIEKFIYNRIDKKIVKSIRKHGEASSGFITDKPKTYYEHYEKKEKDVSKVVKVEEEKKADDEATGLLPEESENINNVESDDEATGLLENEIVENEATGLLEDQSGNGEEDNGTALLENEDNKSENTDGTDLLEEVIFPTLTRVSTGEIITINKPVFRLGKEKSYVDYFLRNNNTISRSHADIITRGKRYFVIDLNSKNKTYINNKVLPIQQETEILDGDILKLSNEEFVFKTNK